MDPSQLTDQQVRDVAKALGVHRTAVRKKLDRLPAMGREHDETVAELDRFTELSAMFNDMDLERAS